MDTNRKLVAILMGSKSDLEVMSQAGEALKQFGIGFDIRVLSAHRAPREVADFSENAQANGYRVLIAGAGAAAHLAGVLASLTTLPVIGVPIANGPLNGVDALYATVQMPQGIPVATVAISNAFNAGILATQILATGEGAFAEGLRAKLKDYKKDLRDKVLAIKL